MLALAGASVVAAPLQGRWGGDHARLVLGSDGGRLQLDCATGVITGPVVVAADGTFTATGRFDEHAPGPQPADTAPQGRVARYSGRLAGDALTLSVQADGSAGPQVFHLRSGVEVKLARCL